MAISHRTDFIIQRHKFPKLSVPGILQYRLPGRALPSDCSCRQTGLGMSSTASAFPVTTCTPSLLDRITSEDQYLREFPYMLWHLLIIAHYFHYYALYLCLFSFGPVILLLPQFLFETFQMVSLRSKPTSMQTLLLTSKPIHDTFW